MISFKMLKTWYVGNKRNLPWRDTKSPYLVWLSEIILQQTKVQQGVGYYFRIIKQYPTVEALAMAKENDLLLLWQGLGYYSRALNLHKTAKIVANQLNGVFPDNYKDLLKLPGIGSYTAAAIASFCYKEVIPVLDGNVYRVISRIYGIKEPINTSTSKKLFIEKLTELIPSKEPDIFNQAMMEFGALQCTPTSPFCDTCPFSLDCVAFNTNTIRDFPVKTKSKAKRIEYRNYFLLRFMDEVAIEKRDDTGIWKNLHEFPVCVSENVGLYPLSLFLDKYKVGKESIINYSKEVRLGPIFETNHILSHIKMEVKFFELTLNRKPDLPHLLWIKLDELELYAFHQLMRKFFQKFII